MALVVQKYGGTSVGDPERIKRVARRVVADGRGRQPGLRRRLGDGRHDRRAARARAQVSQRPAPARARHAAHGRRADLDGAPLDGDHRPRPRGDLVHRLAGRDRHRHEPRQGDASSRCARGRVREAIEAGQIAIVAGFQGVSTDDDVTTLGRGGSDTTAVALAAALDADVCEIYTDVDGVFTADPRIVPERAQAARRSPTRRCSSSSASGAQGADAALGRVRSQPRSESSTSARRSRTRRARGS